MARPNVRPYVVCPRCTPLCGSVQYPDYVRENLDHVLMQLNQKSGTTLTRTAHVILLNPFIRNVILLCRSSHPVIDERDFNLNQRLIRFLAKDGKVYYGDAILPSGVTDIGKAVQARVVRGSPWSKHEVTDQVEVRVPMSC